MGAGTLGINSRGILIFESPFIIQRRMKLLGYTASMCIMCKGNDCLLGMRIILFRFVRWVRGSSLGIWSVAIHRFLFWRILRRKGIVWKLLLPLRSDASSYFDFEVPVVHSASGLSWFSLPFLVSKDREKERGCVKASPSSQKQC